MNFWNYAKIYQPREINANRKIKSFDNNQNRMSSVKEGIFKNNPVLTLKNFEEDKFPFSFGLKKAKLLLAHLPDIKSFVQKYSTES